ncbi:MntP/YtaF family protein [Paenibacillus allorhizosphaerae]|uniref:Sporulation protein YtaF n=1 Tax=Paenibacillus allorhizosphaerae TaxID=2849866 RepID=A0ABM8VRZ8_9BACL|nr:MntP/YtaF family protein [Paenibacillus allorhizosphaerae]CAG7655969.1 putative sporulation protein YtaF [Paenibacillus allorhizosphaerae]
MLSVVSLLLLALAVSLDGFGVGVMYGLRKIRIPLPSVAIISLCSGIIIYLSMQIGVWISRFVDPSFAKTIGAVILMGIGLWAIYQMLTEKHESAEQEAGKPPVDTAAEATEGHPVGAVAVTAKEIVYIELKRLGLVIQILRTPSIADMDRSGNISSSEAMLLGTALSLDAFGAGFGAALLGFTPWLTAAVIALASGTFLSAGLSFGFRFANLKWVRKLSILPGFVLIIMGIMKLF